MLEGTVSRQLIIENHGTKRKPLYKVRPEILVTLRDGTSYIETIGTTMVYFRNTPFDSIYIREPKTALRDNPYSLNGVSDLAPAFGSLEV